VKKIVKVQGILKIIYNHLLLPPHPNPQNLRKKNERRNTEVRVAVKVTVKITGAVAVIAKIVIVIV